MTESSPGLRRATDRQILLPRSAKAGTLALPPAPPQLSELENVETVSGEIAVAVAAGGPRHATISCIIPCYNEQDTIAEVLRSLLGQTRMPDVIHVIINNTDDDTPEIARGFEGRHTRTVKGEEFVTTVHVHDMGANPDKKVGALNYGYFLSRGFDFILGVDGDTTLARDAVERLELEMTDDPRIGGLSAIYSIDKSRFKGAMARFLISGQRAQFAAFNMDNLLRGRNMAVLGGQCSLFNMRALETVMIRHHQQAPWVRDSEVEDSKLSLQIKDAGFSTKISATARAYVGPMTNLRALHGQQVKWNFGAIDLFWPGTRGDNQGQPMHPNLRLRWYENISMVFNIGSRLGFLLLLVAALSIHAFVFNPIWLIPPVVAMILNFRLAMAMKDKSASDLLYAVLIVPAELYMWIRMGHFLSAWTQFLAKSDKDNWAAQANAEKGKGSAYVMPLVVLLAVMGGAIYAWSQQSVSVQSAILSLGWPILYIATIAQTVFMLRKLVRRHRGFMV